jgi:hypothetical protein
MKLSNWIILILTVALVSGAWAESKPMIPIHGTWTTFVKGYVHGYVMQVYQFQDNGKLSILTTGVVPDNLKADESSPPGDLNYTMEGKYKWEGDILSVELSSQTIKYACHYDPDSTVLFLKKQSDDGSTLLLRKAKPYGTYK